MDTYGWVLVRRTRGRIYFTSRLNKWVQEIWGQVLNVLPSVCALLKVQFSLRFKSDEHDTYILYCHLNIEMTLVLLKYWTPLFDLECENLGEGPICVKLPGLPLQLWKKDIFRLIGDDLSMYLDYDRSYLETRRMNSLECWYILT